MAEEKKHNFLIIEDTKSATYVPSHLYSRYLPVSIPFDMGIAFICLMVLMLILPLGFMNAMFRFIFLPALMTFFIFKVKVNYQPLWFYIPKKISHAFSRKTVLVNGYAKERTEAHDDFGKPVTIYWKGFKINHDRIKKLKNKSQRNRNRKKGRTDNET